MDLEQVDPVELAAALSRLSPSHPAVIAARTGAEVSEHRAAMAEASRDVAGGWRADGGVTDARGMWAGRAEVDGPDSAAARKAQELERPPARDEPAGRTYNGAHATATAVAWAREWAAERAAEEAADDARAEQACATHAARAAARDVERNRAADSDVRDRGHDV